MKAFIVAILFVATVSQGSAQGWSGFQGFQRPNLQELAQQYAPAVQQWQENIPNAQKWQENIPNMQKWQENMPAIQNWRENLPGQVSQLPQGNFQEMAQQYMPAVQNWRETMQQRFPQMPANMGQFKEAMQSPFAQNLKAQIPSNYKQVLDSAPFKSWAEKVMTMPNVQSLNLPAQ